MEVEVKVLRGKNPQQILGQYVEFCNISNEQIALHDIMRTLFSQEAVWEIERYNIRQEGRQEGVEAGIAALVNELQKYVSDQASVARSLMNRFGLSEKSAMKKVQQYWES